ncbi:MAG: S8 family peptidase [Candidatus Komeilibacteria bacterium]
MRAVYAKTFLYLIAVALMLPNFVMAKSSNDPFLGEQYYLNQISAPSAWNYSTGSSDIVVAVIDTGVDIGHPDLYANIWKNNDEVPGDGLDNDHNGYIDDVYGWDFIHNESDPQPKLDALHSELGIEHGTIVAGIIGAMGNNDYGIAGINWQVSIMPLVALDGNGNGNLDDVSRAINYAVANGADIINLSLVGAETNSTLDLAISQAGKAGVLVLAAAGNETIGANNADNSLDLTFHPRYPICSDGLYNNVLGVTAVNQLDQKSLFANYGNCVDMSAPGERFFGLTVYQPALAEWRDKFSGHWSGTSLATPVVAGAAALLKAYRPSLSAQEIITVLKDNSDPIEASNPLYPAKLGAGRLNIAASLAAVSQLVHYNDSIVVAPQSDYQGIVDIYNKLGQLERRIVAWPEWSGGINLAVGDLDGDGRPEIITAPAGQAKPQVKVLSWTGDLIKQWDVLNGDDPHGAKVALMDNRILVWSDNTASKVVELWSGEGDKLTSWAAHNIILDISASDYDKDNYTEILILTDRQLSAYNQLGLLEKQWTVADADSMTANGQYFYITATAGQAPWVRQYDWQGKVQKQWLAYADNWRGGIQISAANNMLVTTPNQGGGPHLRWWTDDGQLAAQYFVLDNNLTGGVNVDLAN